MKSSVALIVTDARTGVFLNRIEFKGPSKYKYLRLGASRSRFSVLGQFIIV